MANYYNQLPLSIIRDDATFKNFYPGVNLAAWQAVLNFAVSNYQHAQNKVDNFMYIWGGLHSGKTHLLQAACHEAINHNKLTYYLSLKDFKVIEADIFSGLDVLDFVCIDDLECLNHTAAEIALLHLYNRLIENNKALLIAANNSPLNISIKLEDLKSRLAWSRIYKLATLSDEEKIDAIKLRAQERGFTLDESVGKFLLRHCARNMGDLFKILEKLDAASLAAKRKLTVPFVKQVLEI